MKFLRFDYYKALHDPTCDEMPEDYMDSHYKVIHGIYQEVYNDYWFCVEDYDESEPLPSFLSPMKPYSLNYWKDHCFENCPDWQFNHNICYGGDRCKKSKTRNF